MIALRMLYFSKGGNDKHMDLQIKLPDNVKEIIRILNIRGYDAYAVGGCIRDSLMGKTPSDWDICTSSLPQETLDALGKTNIIENGMKHGTVTVHIDKQNYEITTFRTDGKYLDNRHPENVKFVRSLEEDLSRRDFTVNALAYNERDGLIDLFKGIDDIENKCIRCVGDPDKRFNEDALRILRALRFSSQLGFGIDNKTSESIHKNAYLLKNISAERIMSEFLKILSGPNVENILMQYPDVISVFIPEIQPMLGFRQRNPHHIYDVWEHTVKAVSYIKPQKELKLAAFFHDSGKPNTFTIDGDNIGHFHGHPDISELIANDVLRRLKADSNTIKKVRLLIKLHDLRPLASSKNVRKMLVKTGVKNFPLLLELKRADAKAQNPLTLKEKLEYLDELDKIYQAEIAGDTAFTLKQLKVNGSDLKLMGINEGKKIGMILNQLLNCVIEGELENNKDELLKAAAEMDKRL